MANSSKLNDSQAAPGSVCVPYYTVPDILGTRPVESHMYLCGYRMYDCLPAKWEGRCAAALPADHSYIISTLPKAQHRDKRELYTPHDPLWGTNDRLVLDHLTASVGGVCTIIGSSCCTYIPANDEDGGLIQQGIANLTRLRDAMQADNVTDTPHGLDWLLDPEADLAAVPLNSDPDYTSDSDDDFV
uniref:Uncharacterized protein n=1 Tax=Knipowitschia caucasica TaxID=637954 RepID=A0AAV2KCE5_KNICA